MDYDFYEPVGYQGKIALTDAYPVHFVSLLWTDEIW